MILRGNLQCKILITNMYLSIYIKKLKGLPQYNVIKVDTNHLNYGVCLKLQ